MWVTEDKTNQQTRKMTTRLHPRNFPAQRGD